MRNAINEINPKLLSQIPSECNNCLQTLTIPVVGNETAESSKSHPGGLTELRVSSYTWRIKPLLCVIVQVAAYGAASRAIAAHTLRGTHVHILQSHAGISVLIMQRA